MYACRYIYLWVHNTKSITGPCHVCNDLLEQQRSLYDPINSHNTTTIIMQLSTAYFPFTLSAYWFATVVPCFVIFLTQFVFSAQNNERRLDFVCNFLDNDTLKKLMGLLGGTVFIILLIHDVYQELKYKLPLKLNNHKYEPNFQRYIFLIHLAIVFQNV